MEFALATLLVSSFASVGLLALWTATSRRDWFLRTSVFVGTLSLLLLIPAYEPFVAFILQGAVTAFGLSAYRRFIHSAASTSTSFSLATLLRMMVIACGAAAVAAKLPTLNMLAWRSVILLGITTGLATLVSRWVVYGVSLRLGWRCVVAVILITCISLPLVFGDWFVPSVNGLLGWPPIPLQGFNFSGMFGGYSEDDTVFLWFPVVELIFVVQILFLWHAQGGFAIHMRAPTKRYQRIYRFLVLAALSSVLLAPTIGIFYKLMTPLPIPEQKLPADNGFDDLLAAGRIAVAGQFDSFNFDADTATDKELSLAVAEMQVAYDKIREGLTKEVRMPIDYQSFDGYGLPEVQALRALARCLSGRAQLAAREGRISNALNDQLQTIRLGYSFRPGTIMVNGLLGIAISGVGQRGLYEFKSKLNSEQSYRVIALLERIEQEREPAEAFIYRDRVWEQHSTGWHGHLHQLLSGFSKFDRASIDSFLDAFNREVAVSRLLCTELAIEAYRFEKGYYPDSLDELVPHFLNAVPNDPYAPEASRLIYRLKEQSYVLYSVGTNGHDDGGVLPADCAEPAFWYMNDGDLCLEHFYAPDPPTEVDQFDEGEFKQEDMQMGP